MRLANDSSIKMTLPEERELYGFTVRKVTMGEYINAMKGAQELPEELLNECFESLDVNKAMNILISGGQEEAAEIAVKLIMKAPEPLIRILCGIMRIDAERALQELTPSEMAELAAAFWELNNLDSFFTTVWSAIKPRLHTLQSIGSNGG